jgi:hypothetical protein
MNSYREDGPRYRNTLNRGGGTIGKGRARSVGEEEAPVEECVGVVLGRSQEDRAQQIYRVTGRLSGWVKAK